MAARVFALLTLPAVALAFCPSMLLRGLPAAARSPAARLVASPPLRMAVQEVSSEAELDSLIASAGTRRGCLSGCFGGCGACACRICACAHMSPCGRKCAVRLEARRHASEVDAGADLIVSPAGEPALRDGDQVITTQLREGGAGARVLVR